MQRFYLPKECFLGLKIISTNKGFIKQLSKVLRAKHGDKFVFFHGDGREFLAQLIELNPAKAEFLIINETVGEKEIDREVVLCQSLLKSDKFDLVVQKAVELGVSKIIPIISEFCVVRSVSLAKKARYREIIKEATEQSGGSKLATIEDPVSFPQAISTLAREEAINLIAWERVKDSPIKIINNEKINLFIGPEGGFSEAEILAGQEAGFKIISLGKRVLRAETAAIVALSRLVV